MKLKGLVFILLLVPVALLAFAFGANNIQKVDIDLLFFPLNNTEIGTGLAVAFLLGAVIGLLIGMLPALSKTLQMRKLQKQGAQYQEEIVKLKEARVGSS